MTSKIALTAALATSSLFAAQPTMDELMADLAQAKIAWGYTVTEPIEFRFEPLASCDGNRTSLAAKTQPLDTQVTMKFEDDDHVDVTHQITYVIRLNSLCDFSKLPLKNVVVHEYGHILGIIEHSKNRKSVMYHWVYSADQSITEQDREDLKVVMESREKLIAAN